MSFLSFLRRFGVRRPRKTRAARPQSPGRRVPTLSLEPLESRELLANDTPTILATNVTPAGSTHPTISVVFSESMLLTDLVATSNYLLVDSTGKQVPIQLVTPGTTSSVNDTATLSYNSGNPLNANTYTLFVRGDSLHDVDDNRTLTGPGQLVIANGGRNSVSTVNLPGSGTQGALAQFDLPQQGAPTPSPVAVKLADLDGDGLPDLIAVDSGTNQVEIFRGRSAFSGGGFSSTPDLTLNLPSGAAPAAGSLVVADLHDNGAPPNPLLDIAVANAGTNNVSVFLNKRSVVGQLSFAPAANYAVAVTAVTPVALVAADLNGDGYLDLATANSAATPANNYTASVLLNRAAAGPGTFAAASSVTVGTTVPSGVTAPTGLAAGVLSSTGNSDLVVSGGNGNLAYLQNTTPAGASTASFTVSFIGTGGASTTSVALGKISGTTNNDIVATSNFGGGTIRVFTNSGGATPTFTAVPAVAAGVLAPTAITVADVDGSGTPDFLYTNNGVSGAVVAMLNLTNGGPLTFATPVVYGVDANPTALAIDTSAGRPNLLVTANQGGSDVSLLTSTGTTGNFSSGGVSGASNTAGQPITITSIANGLADGSTVIVRGVQGNTAANGVWVISVVDADHFTLNNSSPNGTYTGGGTWVSPDDLFRVSTDIALSGVTPLPSSVAVGDLNGDGFVDYAVALKNSNQVAVILSTGQTDATGRPLYRSPLYFATGNSPVSVAVGDLNHDGHPDIVVANQQDNTVTVLVQNSGFDGTSYATSTVTVGPSPTQVILADLNHDGYPDLVVTHNRPGASTDQGVTVVLNSAVANSTTPFQGQPAVEYAAAFPAAAVAAADFNGDGNLDLILAGDSAPGQVRLLLGNGAGGFSDGGTFATGVTNPGSIAVADMNLDGFADVIVASKSTGASTGGIAVLLNQHGSGFAPPIVTQVAPGSGLASLAVTQLNHLAPDTFPDVVVSTLSGQAANVYALTGNGDGTFQAPIAYQVGGAGAPAAAPSYLAANTALILAKSFTIGGTSVSTDLVRNGTFEQRDLSGEQGNLLGWQTFDLNSNPGSLGHWSPQSGSLSPLSLVTVPPPPQGKYQAMLDEQDLIPFPSGTANPNAASTYAGSHALYQDIAIPGGPNVTSVTLSFTLYIDDSGANGFYSNTASTTLDWHGPANQQVRVDILDPNNPRQNPFDPNANFLAVTSADGLLLNLFFTTPNDPAVQLVNKSGIDLSAYKGQTIRLRFGSANNQGKLIVGVDNVHLAVQYADSAAPTLTNVGLRNPGFAGSPGGTTPHTTDPTITGNVTDDGGINNIAYIAFDLNGDGNFTGPEDAKTTVWDATGKFAFTPTGLLPGQHTIGVQAVDRAGNATSTTFTFVLESNNVGEWRAFGPNAIDVTNQGVDYTTVSGRITAVVADPIDLSGNTYYVGSANGGVWKTTDGGSSWAPLMDHLTDGSGNPVPAPIGALGLGVDRTTPGSPKVVLYAGTGVADTAFDSRPGVGIFKSTDGGQTWTLAGNSGTVLAGARISKIVVSPNSPNIVYAAVASGGQGPGVYKSTDGGATWVNVMTPAAMGLPAGTALASVTDLVIDPFSNGRLLAGLGNVGLLPASATAGLWISTDGTGGSWSRPLGGAGGITASTLPNGTAIGKVLVGISSTQVGSEPIVYILLGTPPGNNTPPSVNLGSFSGLYKTSNNFLNFTKVMLRQDTSTVSTHNFKDINLLGGDASYTGALVVDPTDPNIVYVGGSTQWAAASSGPVHALVRIDTGDMRDASYVDPNTNTIPNDGDDIRKALKAESQGGLYSVGDSYSGEGVSWYDLIQRATATTGTGTSLPPEIHGLAFDAQGRLLIGTEGGLWRGVAKGYGYDFSSGGRGILGGRGFAAPGVSLTSLNGNLQIADLTSVAIDPTRRGVFYTTQAGTGGAGSGGLLQWVSEGLTGPTVPNSVLGNPNPGSTNLGIPTAGVVVAAPTAPNASPDTPTTLYRLWQYDNVHAAQPEISTDGGKTFNTGLNSGLIVTSNNPAALFPALTLNPNLILSGGVYLDELLFGTGLVFHTASSGNVWDAVPSSRTANPNSPIPLSSTGGLVTALALAPSTSGVYYAGTDKGEVFVTFNGGADNWFQRNTGLPAARVNGITVDPNNPNTAYVMLAAAGGSSVWRTINGGLTWANVTHNLPPVAAYALIIDPRTTGGATNGRIYVATDVGVFISMDLAATWQRLGQGLPNVPVVGLAFNQNLETIAAATQGRGVFTISTDLIGPRVVAITSTVGIPAVQVTFNEAIDPTSVTSSAVTLTGPGGVVPSGQLTFTDLNPGFDTKFQIGFSPSPSNLSGSYTLALQPTVKDSAGNPMDQDQDLVNGSVPDDGYTGRFVYQSAVPNHAPVLGVTATALPMIFENAFTNAGTELATFVAGLGITDADDPSYAPGTALRGIAVTSVDNSNGSWQFSLDGGTTWTNFGTPTGTAARMLEAVSHDRIRFVPNQFFAGTATFTYRAWDLTSGLNAADGSDGGVATAIPNGGSSAFSSASGTANLTVQFVNQPPSFTAGPNQSALEDAGPQTVPNWATNISPGPANQSGETVNFLVSVNNPALFSVQPSVSPTGTLSYTSAPNAFGTAVVTVQAHNNGGTANGGQDTSAPQQFTVTIVQINDAPSFTGGPNVTVTRDAGAVAVLNWATNISAGINESAQVLNFIVTTNNPALFNVQPSVTPDGTLTFTPSTVAGTAVVTVQLHDNGGTANGGQDTSPPQQFTITVQGTAFHGSPNEVWVSQAYLDLLARPVDPAALVFWTDQIEQQGGARSAIAQQLLNSTEYRSKLIQGLFQNLLGRPPTPSDLNTYLQFLLQGGTVEQMKAQFLSSHEYMVHRGVTTSASWINAMYLDVFGHGADATASTFWLNVAGTSGLFAAALGILQSPEASGTTVRHVYETMLGRDPNSAEGVNVWYVELQQGVRDEVVTAGIAASDEYFTRLSALWNDDVQLQNWITGVYQDVLGRPIDQGGLGIWMNALHHGLPRVFITDQIVGSPEYEVHEINQIYQKLLGRSADPQGLAAAEQTLGQGGTLDQVKAVVLGSAEYFFGRGGGTNFGFLNALYLDVLGRPLDSNGVTFWGGQLGSGVDRTTIALQLLGTFDADQAKVQNFYLGTLRRSADPTGQAFWAGQLQAGLADPLVLAGLASTREYFSRFPNH
jgi:hypothetical protein